jgi:hypothetical protein
MREPQTYTIIHLHLKFCQRSIHLSGPFIGKYMVSLLRHNEQNRRHAKDRCVTLEPQVL